MAEPPASVLRPLTATTRLLTRVPWESQQSLLSYSQTLFSADHRDATPRQRPITAFGPANSKTAARRTSCGSDCIQAAKSPDANDSNCASLDAKAEPAPDPWRRTSQTERRNSQRRRLSLAKLSNTGLLPESTTHGGSSPKADGRSKQAWAADTNMSSPRQAFMSRAASRLVKSEQSHFAGRPFAAQLTNQSSAPRLTASDKGKFPSGQSNEPDVSSSVDPNGAILEEEAEIAKAQSSHPPSRHVQFAEDVEQLEVDDVFSQGSSDAALPSYKHPISTRTADGRLRRGDSWDDLCFHRSTPMPTRMPLDLVLEADEDCDDLSDDDNRDLYGDSDEEEEKTNVFLASLQAAAGESELQLASSISIRSRSTQRDTVEDRYLSACAKHHCIPCPRILSNLRNQHLAVKSYSLGSKGAMAVAEALEENNYVESLVLAENDIGAEGAAAVLKMATQNAYLHALDLSSNKLGSRGLQSVSAAIRKGFALTSVLMNENGFGDLDAVDFCKAMSDDYQVLRLHLTHNRFGDAAGVKFGEMLAANSTLKELDLSWNCIRARGGQALAQGLSKNATLQCLRLDANGLADSSTVKLAHALKENETLEELYLDRNNVGEQGVRALAEALRHNTTLRVLSLSYNPISDHGLRELFSSLSHNTSLEVLGLDGVQMNDESKQLHQQIQQTRQPAKARSAVDIQTRAASNNLRQKMRQKPLSRRPLPTAKVGARSRAGADASLASPAASRPMSRQSFIFQEENELSRCPSRVDSPYLLGRSAAATPSLPPRSPSPAAGVSSVAKLAAASSLSSPSRNQYSTHGNRPPTYGHGDRRQDKKVLNHGPISTSRFQRPAAMVDGGELWKKQARANGLQQPVVPVTAVMRSLPSGMPLAMKGAESAAVTEGSSSVVEDSGHPEAPTADSHRPKLIPTVTDPMGILEEYVALRRWRLVDLFCQLDRQRTGQVSVDDLAAAVQDLQLPLKPHQLTELVHRLDLDDDGMIDYHELCEGRRDYFERVYGFRRDQRVWDLWDEEDRRPSSLFSSSESGDQDDW